MKVADFHDMLWYEIPIEKNPAFDWVADDGVHRQEDAVIIYKTDGYPTIMVCYVPLQGDREIISVTSCHLCALLFAQNYKPHDHVRQTDSHIH